MEGKKSEGKEKIYGRKKKWMKRETEENAEEKITAKKDEKKNRFVKKVRTGRPIE